MAHGDGEADVHNEESSATQLEKVQQWLEENYKTLDHWIESQLYSTRETLRLVDAAHTVRSVAAIPANADVISRYPAELDNEWFKTLRALRDMQKHRLEQAALTARPVELD